MVRRDQRLTWPVPGVPGALRVRVHVLQPVLGHEKAASRPGSGPRAVGRLCRCPGVWKLDSFNSSLPAAASNWGTRTITGRARARPACSTRTERRCRPLLAGRSIGHVDEDEGRQHGNITVRRAATGTRPDPNTPGHETIVGLRALEVEILDAEGKTRDHASEVLRGQADRQRRPVELCFGLLGATAGGLAQQTAGCSTRCPDRLRRMPSTRRTRPRGATACVPGRHADGESGWRAAVAGMPGRSSNYRGTDRAGVCPAAARHARPGTRGLRRPRGPERIRHRLHQGGRVNQKNGRTDPAAARAGEEPVHLAGHHRRNA